ncbi:hypothetical protein EB75_19705 [Mycobacterium sp. ST-F2]|uniref:hypothetical protein n=1 Tax=Mycobacterium sp. ST-F2 TaxID=1490484 RepID=UPI000939521F|nr:hypothetical protein [Mycobacterium sp. ST-F2]OKH85598.1 hypothetical protein EB75_19705 [Mycobacterium sp. ST-F2]
MSTDVNIATVQAITEAAKNGTGDFVKLSPDAKKAWVTAIDECLADLNTLKPHFQTIRSNYAGEIDGVDLLSATETKKLLQQTAPDSVEDAVNKYKTYLEDLKEAIETAYKRLQNVDQS